jgi:TolB-like protein
LIPLLGLPDWVGKFIFLLLAIGFPLALVFAWAYELTPEGLKKEKEVDRSQSITSKTGRRLDFLVIGVLIIAVGMLLADKFLLTDSQETTEIAADTIVADAQNETPSIAVLPFVNMSADESSAYFSDGLADTVLHMLAQISELRVAARTSSFQFRDQTLDISTIGAQLNVGTVLEGSVQRSGDKIRVTAQLIDVSNGYHLWSGNFDRELEDVFAIQDEIAHEVVAALKVSLLGAPVKDVSSDQTDNFDAYTEYLLAINELNNVSVENLLSAVQHLQEAIRLDPDYAQAHAMLGRAYFSLQGWGAMSIVEATAGARDAASHALDKAPESSAAIAVLGYAELIDGNLETAGQLLNRATEINPNDTVALAYYARYLLDDARPVDAIATYRNILRLDPLSETAHAGLASALSTQREFSAARDTITRLKSINPNSAYAFAVELYVEGRQGHWAAAIKASVDSLDLDPDDPEGPGWVGRGYLALDMPEEASRWYDRAIEMNAQHPMSRSAPLYLNYYLQQNEDENYRLARELLEDRIDNRGGLRNVALTVLVEYAAKTGRHELALDVLDNLYPHLFDDPPHDLAKEHRATYFVAVALIQSGDTARGSRLMQSYLDLTERYDEAYGANRRSVTARLALGDTEGALEKLTDFSENPYSRLDNKLILERSSLFDPLRDEPAFIELLDEYRRNSEEQQRALQAMNESTVLH